MAIESERPEARSTRVQAPEPRVLRIGIASPQQMRARTTAIARGALRPEPNEPKIWVPSFEALGRRMTEQNTALFARIRATRPASIKDLSRIVERKPSNLLRTLRAMEKHGLVRLRRDRSRALQSVVRFDQIEVNVELPPLAT